MVRNASELKEFRKGHDYKLIPEGPAGCLPKVIPSDVIPSFAYGRKSRPSTPIASVVGGHYSAEQEEALARQYEDIDEERERQSRTIVRMTKGTKERIHNARSAKAEAQRQATEGPKEPFKLSKFKKVESRMKKTNAMPTLPPEPMDASM